MKRSPEEIWRLQTLYNNGQTLQQIGNSEGLTRERIRKLIDTSQRGSFSRRSMIMSICISCGKEILRYDKELKFCSNECRRGYYLANPRFGFGKCEECGKVFPIQFKERPGRWCSHRCGGIWLARNHGFGKHPEHNGRGGRPKKVT